VALGCMALFSFMASACALTTVFNISGHCLSILQSDSVVLHSSPEWTSVQCVLFSYSSACLSFLVLLEANMVVWHCFHPWLSLMH